MNIREASSRRRHTTNLDSLKKTKARPKSDLVLTGLFFIAGALSWLFLATSHASALGGPIKSGWSGYCLDDYRSLIANHNQVELWGCNGTSAQDWQVNLTQIIHDNYCLTADSDSQVTIDSCTQSANQVWLRDANGFLNPNLGLCLTASSSGDGHQLSLASCNNLTGSTQSWSPDINYSSYPCRGTQGQMVACYAIKEWINWTAGPHNHSTLLNKYTAGASFELWCADFVSYVYKEAGYPFSNGNYNGWNENFAPDIVNQGFNVKQLNGYTPQAGDVGYFSYDGGHVEIVVSGGKTPTFIYGDSGTIDPTTGNGDMAANTVLSKPDLGAIQYYLVPTPST